MQLEWLLLPEILYPATVLFGLCCGSFISALSYRLPRDISFVTPPSRCPHCDTVLRARDLIPVLSYLLSRGRCRYCHTLVSPRYPALELLTALSFTGVLWLHGPSWHTLILMGLLVCVIALIMTDLEHYLMPDELQVAMAALGLVYLYVMQAPWAAHLLMAGVAGGLAWGLRAGFRWLRHKEGLGLGDVKFFAVAGLWLGGYGFVLFMLLSGMLGILFALAWRLCGRGSYFPFGPALAVSLLLCVLFPDWARLLAP